MLLPLTILSALISTKVNSKAKKLIGLAFLIVSFSIFFSNLSGQSLVVGGNPDGLYQDARYKLNHPMTKGIKVSQEKAVRHLNCILLN